MKKVILLLSVGFVFCKTVSAQVNSAQIFEALHGSVPETNSLNVNVLGNATTANNATLWNGNEYDPNVAGTNLRFVMGYNSDLNKWTYYHPEHIRLWMGMPSGGETLQSITDRGNMTTQSVVVFKNNGGYGLNVSNGVNADVLIGMTAPDVPLKYGWIQSSVAGTNLILNPDNGGNVGIGTANPGSYKLAVEGVIGARKIKITQTAWADYVFDSSYQLPSLSHVETFIKENKHLPEVPSAVEVKKDGLDLGDNQAILLRKIEELTLYIIQQNKEMTEMKKRLADVEARQSN